MPCSPLRPPTPTYPPTHHPPHSMCSYEMLLDVPVFFDSSAPLDQILAEQFERGSPINTQTDGRIVNCAESPSDPLCTGSTPAAPPPSSAGAPSRAACGAVVAGAASLALMLCGL